MGAFVALLVASALGWTAWRFWQRRNARSVVACCSFPAFLRDKLQLAYPQLDARQAAEVERGLRQFFIASASANGRFVAMPSTRDQRFAGLRRAWYWSCREEGIDPRRPSRLPLLSALDAALAIPGGYRDVPDCRLLGNDRGDTHRGDAFGCGLSCGSSGGSDGDGGGDGGGGCGGD